MGQIQLVCSCKQWLEVHENGEKSIQQQESASDTIHTM